MKKLTTIIVLLLMAIACKTHKQATNSSDNETVKEKTVLDKTANANPMLNNKGIGPIKSVSLDAEVNQEMAAKGKEVHEKMCAACHKTDKKFIGPAPAGIMERRSPEWIMNMILNPEQMVKEDAIAKELLAEYSSPMFNQNLTEEQARAILEYFRTL